ncbi:hypothetical protein Dimus_015369 [Dionaea muscipula]
MDAERSLYSSIFIPLINLSPPSKSRSQSDGSVHCPPRPAGNLQPIHTSDPAAGDPFVDLTVAHFKKAAEISSPTPLMGLTEKCSPTFLSSGNPCLDFFFHVVPNTPPESLTQRLQLAWAHDPLTTLKLICNLRGVRGTGKSDKKGYYSAALWLHAHHPKTLACNVASLAEFGYFKDLPEILFRLLGGVRGVDGHGSRRVCGLQGRRGESFR